VDYLSKPFDPWVLRSKITVFADLWSVQTELASQAADYDTLDHAVETALALLEAPRPHTAQAIAALRQARSARWQKPAGVR
jgi:t-SNARE complex subunit (syntaxin)